MSAIEKEVQYLHGIVGSECGQPVWCTANNKTEEESSNGEGEEEETEPSQQAEETNTYMNLDGIDLLSIVYPRMNKEFIYEYKCNDIPQNK